MHCHPMGTLLPQTLDTEHLAGHRSFFCAVSSAFRYLGSIFWKTRAQDLFEPQNSRMTRLDNRSKLKSLEPKPHFPFYHKNRVANCAISHLTIHTTVTSDNSSRGCHADPLKGIHLATPIPCPKWPLCGHHVHSFWNKINIRRRLPVPGTSHQIQTNNTK